MKNLLVFIFFLVVYGVKSQDTVFFKNSEKLPILLLEVNPDNIKYKRYDNQAGAVYTVLKNEISYITLSNGKKEVFDKAPAKAEITKTDSLKSSSGDSIPNTVASKTLSPACDTIIYKTGKKVPAKIYEITAAEVKYKPINNPDGPVFKILKGELKEVVFSTGMKQKFESSAFVINTNDGSALSTSQDYWMKGTRDAKTYYRHKGGSIFTGIVSLVPPFGLLPAIIISAIPPKIHNLNYPDDRLWQNNDYKRGYQKEAYRLKRKRVWTAFGIGTSVTVLLAIFSAR